MATGAKPAPLGPAVAERLLHLAAYLKREASDGRAVTLENITDDLPDYSGGNYEGTRKKLRRDLTELEESFGIGVDVSDEGEYRLRAPFLGADERRELFAAAAAVHIDDDLQLRPGDLAAGVDSDFASVWMHLHRMVRALADAIKERRAVEFVHDGLRRAVEPWALGHWRRRWYLVGYDRDHEELRRFRLDRIEEDADGPVTPVGPSRSYEIPEEFEPAKAFDLHPDAWGHDAPARARLLVDPGVAGPLATQLQGAVTGEEEGMFVVEAEVRHYDAFVDRILAAGDRAVLVEPPVIVERVREHLRALVDS